MSSPALAPCDAFVAPLGARAVGALDDAGRAALEAHLATSCAGCAALAADLEAALDAVRLPEEEPAPGGWERVRLRLDDDAAAAAPAEPVAVKVRCTYCKDDLAKGAKACCATCLAPHHADCFAEHGRCAAPGCAETRILAAAPSRQPTRRLPWLLAGALVLAGGSVAAWQVVEQRSRDRAAADLARQRTTRAEKSQADLAALLEDFSKRSQVPTTPDPQFDGQPLRYWLDSLADHSAGRREQARTALATFGEPAVAGTVGVLGHRSPEVRTYAALALRDMGLAARPAIGPLARALASDESRAVRDTCVSALAAILSAVYSLEPRAADQLAGVEALAKALREDADAGVRVNACAILGTFLPAYGLDPLLVALRKDPDERVRCCAAEALLKAQPTTAVCVTALIEALETDASANLRYQVLSGLLTVRPPALCIPARAAVHRLLSDPSAAAGLREHAVEVLESTPLSATDLVALSRATPLVTEAREALGASGVTREAYQGLLQELPRLPEAAQFHTLRSLCRRLAEEHVDPDGALLAPLLGPEVPARVRYLAAWVLLRREGVREAERQAVAVRVAPAVLPDLFQQLDTSQFQTASEVVAALGTAAVTVADGLAARTTSATLQPEARGTALDLLACVAPTESRTDALTAAALRGVSRERDAAFRVAYRLADRVGPQTLSTLGSILATARDDSCASAVVLVLERLPHERVPLHAIDAYLRDESHVGSVADRARELARRVRAQVKDRER